MNTKDAWKFTMTTNGVLCVTMNGGMLKLPWSAANWGTTAVYLWDTLCLVKVLDLSGWAKSAAGEYSVYAIYTKHYAHVSLCDILSVDFSHILRYYFAGTEGTMRVTLWNNTETGAHRGTSPGHWVQLSFEFDYLSPVRNFHLVFRGNESRLVDCDFAGWEMGDCYHSQDAGVICGMMIFFFILMRL